KLQAERNRGLPREFRIIARPMGKTRGQVDEGVGERRLGLGEFLSERRQRPSIERGRGSVVESPAAECQEGSRRVVRGKEGGSRTQLVRAGLDRDRPFGR